MAARWGARALRALSASGGWDLQGVAVLYGAVSVPGLLSLAPLLREAAAQLLCAIALRFFQCPCSALPSRLRENLRWHVVFRL